MAPPQARPVGVAAFRSQVAQFSTNIAEMLESTFADFTVGGPPHLSSMRRIGRGSPMVSLPTSASNSCMSGLDARRNGGCSAGARKSSERKIIHKAIKLGATIAATRWQPHALFQWRGRFA